MEVSARSDTDAQGREDTGLDLSSWDASLDAQEPQFMAPMKAHPKGLSSMSATSGPRLLGVLR